MQRRISSILRNLDRAGEVLRCPRETALWRDVTFAYLGVKQLTYPYELSVRGLRTIELHEISDLWAFWQIFVRRIYPVAGREATIVDAGANIGVFTLLAAREAPAAQIIAIEPFPESFARLTQNVERNGLSARVTCINSALGGHSETLAMKLGAERSQARRVMALNPNQNVAVAPVQARTLEDILRDRGIQKVDLLKMDIEGSEYDTLLSTPAPVLQRIRHVSLEYHPDIPNHSPDELFAHLQGVGFRVVHDLRNSKGFGVALFESATA